MSVSSYSSHTDVERLAAVVRYEILDAPRDGSFDDIAAVAAAAYGVPIATVSIVDSDRVWFAATHGLDGVAQISAEPGLCASAVLADELYLVTDAALDPRTLDHPLVRGEFGLGFYAAAPIRTSDGHALGTVNIIDRAARDMPAESLVLLTHLAAIAARQLDLRLAAIRAVREERRLRDAAVHRATEAATVIEQMRAAAPVHGAAAHPDRCQLGGRAAPCPEPAALKLADPRGDSAWGCERHVEDALVHVRSAFLADLDQAGLTAYLNR